jgi:hypothetical protein
MDFRTRKDFVDPRRGLEAEFEAARTLLRKERAEPKTIVDRLRRWLDERRLHREMVTKPARAARW